MNNLGQRIKACRIACKLTQEDVARHLGIGKQAVYKYECGAVTNIPLENIEKMAALFGVPPEYLSGWSDIEEAKNQNSIFRERFSELVSSSGKSQSLIASEFGVAKQTISAWITGQSVPRAPVLSALADYFDVNVAWLAGNDAPKVDTRSRMKECRLILGYSAEQVASELNLNPATIYRYENGDISKMPSQILKPLADFLCTTPGYLMGWSDEGRPSPGVSLSPDEKDLIGVYRSLNKEGKEYLRQQSDMAAAVFKHKE